MRFLNIVHQYPPEAVGGTELYTQAVARSMAARGHSVSVFCPSSHSDAPPPLTTVDEAGVRIHRVALGPRSASTVFFDTFRQRTLSSAFALALQQEHPDLVHVQHLMGLPAVSLVNQIQAAGIPYIVTLHDYWYVCANAQLLTNTQRRICAGPHWWINCGQCALARAGQTERLWLAPAVAPLLGYRERRLQHVLKNAAWLIAPTEFVRETYRQLGAPADRIRVIPHGIEVPRSLSAAPAHSDQTLRVAYIGGLAWQKGVHVLVESVAGMPAEDVHLSIYGDTTAFPDYVADLRQRARQPQIEFSGRLDRANLWQVLCETDVVVVPSLWYETASLIIQEAFAASVPVIASDLGALRERVRDNIDGLLFAPGDPAALRAVLQRCRAEPGLVQHLRAGIRPVRLLEEHLADLEALYADTVVPRAQQ